MTAAVRHARQPGPTGSEPPGQSAPPHPKYWTKEEYNVLVDQGAFQGQRVYLFRGGLIEMSPMGNPHARAIMKIAYWAHAACRPQLEVRVQMPFITPGDSMPEPDLLICTPKHLQHQPHPAEALLIIEVSDTSLTFDREKALEYAAAGVPDYWIVDLTDRCVEIYRNPVPDRSALLGFRYPPPTVSKEDEAISPLALAGGSVKVAELLP